MAYVTPTANGSREWARVATRPVIGPGVNTWLLVARPAVWHGTEEQIATEEVEMAAGDALAFWLGFPHRWITPGVKVLSIEASKKPLTLDRPSSERRESLPQIPTVSGSPWYVRVKFLSELARTSMPWPVITRDAFGWIYAPSSSAEWLLLQAETPRPPDAAEKKEARSIVEQTIETATDTGATIGKVALGLGAILAGAFAAGIFFRGRGR